VPLGTTRARSMLYMIHEEGRRMEGLTT